MQDKQYISNGKNKWTGHDYRELSHHYERYIYICHTNYHEEKYYMYNYFFTSLTELLHGQLTSYIISP